MPLEIIYLPRFIKKYRKLPKNLREEVREKIELFSKKPRHPFLKTHKLSWALKGRWSFSVNYEYRVVFRHLSKEKVVLLCVGNHDIYK